MKRWPAGKLFMADKERDGILYGMSWQFTLVIFGGFIGGLSWVLTGCLWCITIVGIPFGLQQFKLAKLALMPFGATVVTK